ncbi:MAG: hypothetical protein ACKO4V_01255 [Planctomycetota bacterium]
MKSLAIFGAVALVASSASAAFTGFSVDRAVTAEGNTQYKVYANWDQSNAVMLNAFNFVQISGNLFARHQDAGEDADGNPLGSWSANVNILGTAARNNDSWVTVSGSGTSGGNDTSLDPSFSYPAGSFDRSFIPNNAGWFDATPGSPNAVLAGGTQGGYRMLLVQIVRSGSGSDPIATFGMTVGWKLANTTTALFAGTGQVITIGVPAPGALALLGLAGLTARRRRG